MNADELLKIGAELDRLTNLRWYEALKSTIKLQMANCHRALMAIDGHLKADIERPHLRDDELSKQVRNMMMAVNNIKSEWPRMVGLGHRQFPTCMTSEHALSG